MRFDDDEDLESTARRLRQLLNVDDQLRPDMITVVIKLKHHGLIKDYVRVPDHEMPNDEASFDSSNRLLYLRESTFCAANAAYTYTEAERRRARYTIAHEIGHIALGHQGLHFRGKTHKRAQELGSKIRARERAAERFAVAFLAPAHLAEAGEP